MKKNEFVQIKGSDLKELILKVKTLRGEIANLTMDKNMKKLKDLKMISKKKKEQAQLLTIIRQKQLLTQLEAKVVKQELEDVGVKEKKGDKRIEKSAQSTVKK